MKNIIHMDGYIAMVMHQTVHNILDYFVTSQKNKKHKFSNFEFMWKMMKSLPFWRHEWKSPLNTCLIINTSSRGRY